MMKYALVIAALGLTACQMEGRDDPMIPNPDHDEFCPEQEYSWLIGQNIAEVSLPSDLNDRIIAPDTPVTQDFRPDRLNIMIDEDGFITDLDCG